MRAAVVRNGPRRRTLQTETLDDPICLPGQVLVRMTHVGICGSDLHALLDPADESRPPGLVMGHEPAGEIAVLGEGVSGLAVGDRVTIDPQVTCGVCEQCRQGWISICENKRVIGSGRKELIQGGMAELMAVSSRQVFRIPAEVDLSYAAMIEPLANAVHVVNRSEINRGELTVVLGAGSIGLCIVQCLRNAGAGAVIVTDVSEEHRRVALALGATAAVDPRTGELRETVMDLTNGEGADVVVESVGIDATYQQALDIVRRRGRVMFFGAIQPQVSLPLLSILHKEILIVGCTGANEETSTAIKAVADGSVDLEPLITHRYVLEEADQAIETLLTPDSGAIKVLVTPTVTSSLDPKSPRGGLM